MHILRQAAEDHQPEILRDILDLVAVETYSTDLPALAEGLDKVRSLAIRHLGEPADAIVDDDGIHGGVLRMTYSGTGEGHVVIIGHYDTVWPTGTLEGWPPAHGEDSSGRATVTGPGIFDMKTGLVQGIWALKFLQQQDAPRPTVTFLFNGDEEIGSIASRRIIEHVAATADAVLVLEPTSGGAVKTGRKGVGIFRVTATGIEAHAGLNPTAGASAIHALAEVITAAVDLADLDRGTSINAGLISGGSGTNVSAGLAEAAIDIRVDRPEEIARIDQGFDAIAPSDPRVDLKIDHYWNRPPMTKTEPGAKLFDLVASAAADLGHDLVDTSVGGGSDANFVSALGIPVLCGMGAVGDGAHARHEFIYPDQIPLFTALTSLTLQQLADGLN